MITNERQYKITKAQAERFKRALADLDETPREGVHPSLLAVSRDALVSQLDDLRRELEEYEQLKTSDTSVLAAASFDEFAEGLIRARIALGISQKQLAERLGLKPQQIQRYEAERYGSASLSRLREVAAALGIKIQNNILMPVTPNDFESLLKKIKQVGLDSTFVLSRLLPFDDAARARGDLPVEDDSGLVTRTVETLSRVFGWTRDELISPPPLSSPRFAAATARFKMPAKRSSAATSIYAAYANYLAVVALTGMRNTRTSPIPVDASSLRANLLQRSHAITLKATLHYTWDLGVPVLPLHDKGAFHGACWRFEGRNVIVLKQNSPHQARWLFDLLHELFHAAQRPDADSMEVIEADETSLERRSSSEEIAASEFAGNVLLDGRADEIAQACAHASKGSVELLKSVVPQVAKKQRVDVGALANYLAFRLSWQNINWWGAAANLQKTDTNPWLIARDVFLERFPFALDSRADQQLLELALQ